MSVVCYILICDLGSGLGLGIFTIATASYIWQHV